jgi:hypothetical protein
MNSYAPLSPFQMTSLTDLDGIEGGNIFIVFFDIGLTMFLLLCLFQSSFGTFIAINLNDKLPKHCRMVPETHVRRRKRLRGEDDSKSSNTPFSQSDRRRNSNPPHQKYDPLAKNCTICLHYNSMLHLDFLGPNQMIVVEQPWLRVISTFPEALQRRVYGFN